MKEILKKISDRFRLYYEATDGEIKFQALKDAIMALSELSKTEDNRKFAANFIAACGHNYDVKVIEKLVKEFQLSIKPGYRFSAE